MIRLANVFPVVCLGILSSCHSPAPVDPDPGLAVRVWEYVDAEDDARARELLDEILKDPDADVRPVEEILRKGRTLRPAPTGFAERPLRTRLCEYETTFLFRGPAEYDVRETYPLLLLMHGGGGITGGKMDNCRRIVRDYIDPWLPYADRCGIFLAAPSCDRNWGGTGQAVIRAVIETLSREFPIDPDRIYIWGQSMGGNCAMRSAMHFQDWFAAAAPVTCGYPYPREILRVLENIPVYHIWSHDDLAYGRQGRMFEENVKDLGFDLVSRDLQGGHLLFEEEFPAILDFFLARRRDLYRKRVVAQLNAGAGTSSGRARLWNDQDEVGDWVAYGGGKHVTAWRSPLSFSRFYWVEITGVGDPPALPRVIAEVKKGNRIETTATNVKQFRLYLHDRLVDLDRPVEVLVNGETAFRGTVDRSLKTLLEGVREWRDPGRIFFAALDIQTP